MPKRQRLAEIGIQVGHNRRGQQDGDVLEVIPELARRRHWAEVLSSRKVATGKRFKDGSPERRWLSRDTDGKIPADDVLADYLGGVHKYQFRLLSNTELEITEIATATTQTVPANGTPFINQFTGRTEAFNHEYVARRLAAGKKPMFKDIEGKVIWFGGGGRKAGHTEMDTVWTAVESKLQVGEENYLFYPHGSTLRRKLILMTGDVRSSEAGRLTGTLLGHMKAYRIAWLDLDEISPKNKRDIVTKNVTMDVRQKMTPLVLSEVAQIRGVDAPLLEPQGYARRK